MKGGSIESISDRFRPNRLSGKINMIVRTLAAVTYTLDAEVELHAQPPSWKMTGKPLGDGLKPVVCKMDNYFCAPGIPQYL